MLEFWLKAAFVAVFAYFCGCFNGAVIVSKYILRDDVRNHGSGNAGLTNFYRTFGGPLTLVVILTDVVKAVVALWVAELLIGSSAAISVLGMSVPASAFAQYWAAVFCLVGHMFPVMFGFKGGKGILSGGTIAIMVDWRVALVVWGGFLILVLLTRYVSLGSVWAGVSFPVATWFVFQNVVILMLAIVSGGLVVYKHKENIRRLLTGTENKLSLHKKK